MPRGPSTTDPEGAAPSDAASGEHWRTCAPAESEASPQSIRDTVIAAPAPAPAPADRRSDEPVRSPRGSKGPALGGVDAARTRQAVAAKLFGAAAVPVRIGRFVVLHRIGAGGMGIVYAAYDEQLDRKVAIKVLTRDGADERERARLSREAQALARLSHPNVVQVYEVGTHGDSVFVAMEYVRGTSLRAWRPEATLDEVLDIFAQAAVGLAAAHDAGLIHRDFKPENVMVADDGRVRVLDFGLARAHGEANGEWADPELEKARIEALDSFDQALTRTGAILGTPAYMAPEQFRGDVGDHRVDQFAFCVALWERVFGQRPFAGTSMAALAAQVMAGSIRAPPSERRVPAWLRRVLVCGLSPHPDRRFQDMRALWQAVEAGRAAPRRRRRAVAVFAVLAGIAGVWGATRAAPTTSPCAEVRHELDAAWSDDVRARLSVAFESTGSPGARDTFSRAAFILDTYASDWLTRRENACHAALSEGSASEITGQRLVCLAQRRRHFEQLLQLFAAADADVVRQAVDAASSLPPIIDCSDERLASTAGARYSGASRRESEAIEAELAKADAKRLLGRYDDAVQIADAVLASIDSNDDPSVAARALLAKGTAQSRAKQAPAAQLALVEAARMADRAGDDATRAAALVALVRVVGYDLALPERAAEIAGDAEATIARTGRSPTLLADLEGNRGSIAMQSGRPADALAHHQAAFELRVAEYGEDHASLAASLTGMGNALGMLGRHTDAETMHRRALASFERIYGPGHPYVASALNNVGNSLLERGRGEDGARRVDAAAQAEPLYRRSLEIREQEFGRDHALVGSSAHNLGESLRIQGRSEEAIALFRRAIAVKEGGVGAEHPTVALSAIGLGRALFDAGDRAGSEAALRRAIAILEARGDGAAPDVLGEACLALSRTLASGAEGSQPASTHHEQARVAAERAVAAYARAGDGYAREAGEAQRWLDEHWPQAQRPVSP